MRVQSCVCVHARAVLADAPAQLDACRLASQGRRVGAEATLSGGAVLAGSAVPCRYPALFKEGVRAKVKTSTRSDSL